QLPVSIAWSMLCLLLALTALLPAIGWGLASVLWLRAALISRAALRALDLPTADAQRALRGGLAVAMGTALVVLAADPVARCLLGPPAAWLAVDIVTGAVAMPLGIVAARAWLAPGLRFLLAQLAGRLP